MTAPQSISKEEPRKLHRLPLILWPSVFWLALALIAVGCMHRRNHPDIPVVVYPVPTPTNPSPEEQNPTPPPNPYAHLPGTYEDQKGKRTLVIHPATPDRFRFVISAQATGEVFYDAVLNPDLRVTQSATNDLGGVSEAIVIEEIQTASVRLKRLDTPVPESILFEKVTQ